MTTSNVNSRPNKTAKGFTKNHERNVRIAPLARKVISPVSRDVSHLILYGTCDDLAARGGFVRRLSKKISIEHPVDKGYFKEVYVLSQYGKNLLRYHKQNQQ